MIKKRFGLKDNILMFWAGPLTIVLPKIIPYLVLKKRSAELMLEAVMLSVYSNPRSLITKQKIADVEERLNHEFFDVLHRRRKEKVMTREEAVEREQLRYGNGKTVMVPIICKKKNRTELTNFLKA
jgi:hypothetical protein